MDINLIELNSLNNSKKPIYINTAYIGHFYEVEEKSSYGSVDKPKHTVVGVVTHNNGGFNVKETPNKFLKCYLSQNLKQQNKNEKNIINFGYCLSTNFQLLRRQQNS